MQDFLWRDRIKRLRKSKNLTQGQLGERAGLSQGMISLLESGDRNITINNVMLVVAALDVEIYEIFLPPEKEIRNNIEEKIKENQLKSISELLSQNNPPKGVERRQFFKSVKQILSED